MISYTKVISTHTEESYKSYVVQLPNTKRDPVSSTTFEYQSIQQIYHYPSSFGSITVQSLLQASLQAQFPCFCLQLITFCFIYLFALINPINNKIYKQNKSFQQQINMLNRTFQSRKVIKDPIKSPSPDSSKRNGILLTKVPMQEIKDYFQKEKKLKSPLSESKTGISSSPRYQCTTLSEKSNEYLKRLQFRVIELQKFEKKYIEQLSENTKLKYELNRLRRDLNQYTDKSSSNLLQISESFPSNIYYQPETTPESSDCTILKEFNSRLLKLTDQNKKLTKQISQNKLVQNKYEYVLKDNQILREEIKYMREKQQSFEKNADKGHHQKYIKHVFEAKITENLQKCQEKYDKKIKDLELKIEFLEQTQKQLKQSMITLKNKDMEHNKSLKIIDHLSENVNFNDLRSSNSRQRPFIYENSPSRLKDDKMEELEHKMQISDKIIYDLKLKLQQSQNNLESYAQAYEMFLAQEKTKAIHYDRLEKDIKAKEITIQKLQISYFEINEEKDRTSYENKILNEEIEKFKIAVESFKHKSKNDHSLLSDRINHNAQNSIESYSEANHDFISTSESRREEKHQILKKTFAHSHVIDHKDHDKAVHFKK